MKLNNNNKSISKKYKLINDKTVISFKGHKCIGPCYPKHTIFYNPFDLVSIEREYPSCPIVPYSTEPLNNKDSIYFNEDKCKEEDVNEDYKNFDIFDNSNKIAQTELLFLVQIYNIKNIEDIIYFLNDSIDILPIYSQKRLLIIMFNTYNKYIEFPIKLFSEKIQYILNNIYNLDISLKQIISNIHKINTNKINDIFLYFTNKYSK